MMIDFAFDPGTDSLGWAVFRDCQLEACGVHLFRQPGLENQRGGAPAGRDKALRRARKRRMALMRRIAFQLAEFGLLPDSRAARDALFALPLNPAPSSAQETGRALLHLARRRGPPCCKTCPLACVNAEACPRRQSRARLLDLWEQGRLHWPELFADSRLGALDRLLFGGAPAPRPRVGKPDAVYVRAMHAAAAVIGGLAARYGQPGRIACEISVAANPPPRLRGAALRLQMWRRAARSGTVSCPYSGAVIDEAMAQSRLVEIDHIVPRAALGGDAPGNLALCLASANRQKGARTPFEAYGGTRQWPETAARSRAADRSAASARERPADFTARQAQLITRIGRGLMRMAASRFSAAQIIAVTPAELAAKRGIIAKDRCDHRHHALDAACAGLAGFGLALGEKALEAATEQAVISRGGRSKRLGRLHEQTVYALRADGSIATRKPLSALSRAEIGKVCDPVLRQRLEQAAQLGLPEGLNGFGERHGVSRVRITRKAADAIVLPPNEAGAARRAVLPLAHAWLDIVQLRGGAWKAHGATRHDAAQKGWRPAWEGSGALLVMRLRRDDFIALDGPGGQVLRRVVRLMASKGTVWLAPAEAAGNLAARHADASDAFRFEFVSAAGLKARKAAAVSVSPSGEIRPRKSNAACLGGASSGG